jgi:hypothetical protein
VAAIGIVRTQLGRTRRKPLIRIEFSPSTAPMPSGSVRDKFGSRAATDGRSEKALLIFDLRSNFLCVSCTVNP